MNLQCLLLVALLFASTYGRYYRDYDKILNRVFGRNYQMSKRQNSNNYDDFDRRQLYQHKRASENRLESHHRLYNLLSDIVESEENMGRRNKVLPGQDHLIRNEPKVTKHALKMPNVAPKEPDTYLCVASKMSDYDSYITKFEPSANMKIAHHMLLFGCETPFQMTGHWKCREMQPVCGSGTQAIKYAWGRNAPSLEMPHDVGFHVGGKSSVKYLVLQVHYLHVDSFKDGKTTDTSGIDYIATTEKPKYFAGIYLLAAGWPPIPPHKERFHMDMSCLYHSENKMKFYPFRFRVHAHKLGAVITAYRVRNGKYTLIGRGDPQRPQAFYPVDNDVDIQSDDLLIGRCTFNSTSRDTRTYIGATHNDEMCNFYTMYFYDASVYGDIDHLPCLYGNRKNTKYPADSDVTLAEIERKSSLTLRDIRVKKKLASLLESGKGNYINVKGWPKDGASTGDLPLIGDIPNIGQIAGVDVAGKFVIIFHRGERSWESGTFDQQNNLASEYRKPIVENTLIWLDAATGKVVKFGGANLFYLPHGITIDHLGNIWLTDVGSHQVFKLNKEGNLQFTLGEKFVNGNDEKHFCKPTDVAVLAETGEFFVADGYCNSRVVKFDSDGNYKEEITAQNIGPLGSMNVVHSLALDEANKRLFVGDRENNRVVVFNSTTKECISKIQFRKQPVYAIAFNKEDGGILHAVTQDYKNPHKASGYTYSLKLESLISTWNATMGFKKPHDLAVSKNNQELFVAEIGPNKILKFTKVGRP